MIVTGAAVVDGDGAVAVVEDDGGADLAGWEPPPVHAPATTTRITTPSRIRVTAPLSAKGHKPHEPSWIGTYAGDPVK